MQDYCPDCGNKLILKELKNEGMIPFCQHCNSYKFKMYNVAVSIITVNKENNKILLIQQYGKTNNILVAGYVNHGEKVEDALYRELKEETNLTPSKIKFNRTSFFEKSNTLMINFTAFVDNDKELKVNEEVDNYHWFTYDEARENIYPNSLAAYFLNSYLDE